MSDLALTFPTQLDRVRDGVLAQGDTLRRVAQHYADAIQNDGLVHVYANGHSRVSVEEMVVRMGALTGFHPLLAPRAVELYRCCRRRRAQAQPGD